MTLRLAVRALLTRPVRTGVLACGFGFGIAVMAALLGVGDVILEQARSPALAGGGDVVVGGASGTVASARFVMSRVLVAPPLAARVRAVSPSLQADLYMVRDGKVSRLRAQGGIPSLESAVGDPETSGAPAWADAPSDRAWASPAPGDVLAAMDRFHPIPDEPAWEGSWAEWLYFNGRSRDGSARFYLTFLVGPRTEPGRRIGGVRLQLERNGITTSHSRAADVFEDAVLSEAPDLAIGPCRVRLDGMTYRIDLDLPGSEGAPAARGSLWIRAEEGRSMPPFAIRGARGWVSGYAVPVLSGEAGASLRVGGESFSIEKGTGYHDHNWGFWEGVTWQWGQVAHEGLSFVYGRVHPPADAADPDRIPGFLGVLGPDGPLGYSTKVTIEEEADPADRASTSTMARDAASGPAGRASASDTGVVIDAKPRPIDSSPSALREGRPAFQEGQDGPPRTIRVRARGPEIDLTLTGTVESAVRTHMGGVFTSGSLGGPGSARSASAVHDRGVAARASGPPGTGEQRRRAGTERPRQAALPRTSFLQLRARFHVTGRVGDRRIDFTSLGSAETFRSR